jgi:peptidoglycan/LPS O-acetylase OafA/YrhL
VAFIFSIAICVLTAWLGWRILENPSMRFSKRIDLPKVAN